MRILLCEDEVELSNALVTILKHSNYSIDAVYDGEEALMYLETENYDAVILDIMMPKVDGITVLKTIRSKNNNVPVLMLTAKSEIDDKVKGLDFGADDYLTKPFAIKELLARLRSITRRKTEVTDSNLSFGNITLSRVTFELKSDNGDSFRLANKEFQMLEMFMMNPHSLIPTEKFMEKIWGYDSESEINVVWVYISYLRKKLLKIGSNVQIKASRNMGYSLEEK
ncbi:response regulator transcription factor [Clostridium sp. BJN0001]|uniref:response regulator transcription factor n=1 Tax=Clostridium sp. BJN0001 TaxID=2930219 RepID=UPI001FD4C99C|nr:response regulator transcription factor [Clostridium sp. BJN0001]